MLCIYLYVYISITKAGSYDSIMNIGHCVWCVGHGLFDGWSVTGIRIYDM